VISNSSSTILTISLLLVDIEYWASKGKLNKALGF
jgi:hypothetical protein